MTYSPDEATEFTRLANRRVLDELPFDDVRDFEDAQRGFLGTYGSFEATNAAGLPVWDLAKFDFLNNDDIPDTVNPSLWRIARLNLFNGLFQVTERVFQIRGFDLSNMTIIEGDTGVIVIDPLVSTESAALGMKLYREHRGNRPVKAVIYTHSHADHYGGVKGVVTEADVAAGLVEVVAPDGFMAEAVSENVYAGAAMQRRTSYQYGYLLPAGPTGSVDAGLGKSLTTGSVTLIAPTLLVTETGERHTIDGVDIEFFMAPHTEAPAEFMLWLPQDKVLNTAEDVTHTIHNILTLRGAQVRDAMAWWKALNAVLTRYGAYAEVVIAQHHWPVWGNGRIVELIEDQRDLYKFLHDQVLHMANNGLTMVEIAEQIALPDAIGKKWHNRGYYGSLNHNAKAVYQRYLGWYDSNPSTLYQYPPAESAKRFVKLAGGADAVLASAQSSFDEGDYRWVAEVASKLVFADPADQKARELAARALEQLGYQAENPTWRNEFLNGALELRHGAPKVSFGGVTTPDVLAAMEPELLLDYLGIRLDGPRAAASRATILWCIPDADHSYTLELARGVLIYTEDKAVPVNATLTAPVSTMAALVTGTKALADAVGGGMLTIDGDQTAVATLFELLGDFEEMFNIIEP